MVFGEIAQEGYYKHSEVSSQYFRKEVLHRAKLFTALLLFSLFDLDTNKDMGSTVVVLHNDPTSTSA
jgi:hypothetical protein